MDPLSAIIVALVSSIGIGNLLLALYQRYTARRDKREQLHETGREAELTYSDRFQDRLLSRLDRLESERDNQVDLLRKDNERQEEEIEALQRQIKALERQVLELSEAIEILNAGSALDVQQLKRLLENIEIIQTAIAALDFVPTGPPTDADKAAVRRLKEIRDAGQEIVEITRPTPPGK